MSRRIPRLSTALLLNAAIAVTFVAAAALLILAVRASIREAGLRDAEKEARLILDRYLAIHTYFTHRLKPAVFPLAEKAAPPGYFEPAWMSSTYAVREIDKLFHTLSPRDYYYKECAINARSPENEADEVERTFIERLNRDPTLIVERMERVIDGQPYFTVLRRGEAMEQSCLRCHDTPEVAPRGLVDRYGPTRSFHREANEVVSAVSIRIPLSIAYADADRTVRLIALTLVGGLVVVLFVQVLLNRVLILRPLGLVQEKANEISTDANRLGEQIPLHGGREIADLSASFNRMSAALRDGRDRLEETVAARTAALQAANQDLTTALAEVKTLSGFIPICASCKKIRDDQGFWQQVESYIAQRSAAQFTHGICPECARTHFPEYLPRAAPEGGEGTVPPRT